MDDDLIDYVLEKCAPTDPYSATPSETDTTSFAPIGALDNRGEATPIDFELALNQLTQEAASPLPKPPKPMRNPARERLKRELVFLREYSNELEGKLDDLQSHKRLREATSQIATPDNTVTVAWQSRMEAERTKRLRSERENERLRRSLQTQLRVAEELSAYLRQRVVGLSPNEEPTHIPPMLVLSSFNLVVDQFQNDIDRAYASIGSVFPGPSWQTLPDERVFVTTVKTRKFNGADQMYIELLDTAHRSHPYERTSDAAWEATRLVYANNARVTNVGASCDKLIAARYRSTGQTRRGTEKELVTNFVAKRFIEQDRTVIVWRTCNSPAQHDSDMPVQALSDETGWMVVTKVPEGVPNRAAGTAFFQACSRLVPVWFDGDVADSTVRTQLAIGEFTNVVLSATESDVSNFESAFQRLVLSDEACSVEQLHEPDQEGGTFVAFV